MNLRLIAGCCLLALAACNGEKRRLTEQLAVLEQQHATVSQRLRERTSALRISEDRFDTLSGELITHNTETHQFIESHKFATVCIRAARISWGEGNAFENDISAESRFGAALCGVALLSSDFAQEVASVAEKLRHADKRAKELGEQISAMKRTIEADRFNVQQDQSSIDQLNAEITVLRRRLEE